MQNTSKYIFIGIITSLIIISAAKAQIYVEKQTRHRFAQLSMGYEYTTSFGGSSAFRNANNQLEIFDFTSRNTHKFIIGGTHFWGHADFYFAVYGFSRSGGVVRNNNFSSFHRSGYETVFKYYPWRIEHNKIRPFIGTGVVPYNYQQNDNREEYGKSTNKRFYRAPLITGFTFNYKIHLLNVSLFYNFSNKIDYFISRTEQIRVKSPPLYLSIGYKIFIDATILKEKKWETGEAQQTTKEWAAKGKLDGFFIGIGPSTGYGLGKSSYNRQNRPYLNNFDAPIMADISAGYFWHKPNLNANIAWRTYRSNKRGFGAIQNIKRNSFALELSHGLFDYKGFVPLLGSVLSYEILSAREQFEGVEIFNVQQKKLSFGIIFGWDIRPTHKDWWYLRTNLRYFPNLKIDVKDGLDLSAGVLEFNFIQLVLYPKRMFK